MTRLSGFPQASARIFRDRREAGLVLSQELSVYLDRDALILGLARGGVPVGWEVAAALRAPLDVFLVRKLGVPEHSELAMGALASGGHVVINDDVVSALRIGEAELQSVIDSETTELRRREQAYRGGRPAPDLEGRLVILVDDGIATGASMLVAVRAVRAAGSASVVVAVPVAPASACQRIGREADTVVCATTPVEFSAVGQAYTDFRQVSDDEVRELLATPTVGAR